MTTARAGRILTFEQVFNCKGMENSDATASAGTAPAGQRMAAGWEVSESALVRASQIFRALGDGPRLSLLALLARGEACVSDVAQATGDEISTISQRLRVLRNEGLVSRRRQGKHVVYGLADQHVVDLIGNALAHAQEPRQVQSSGTKERSSNNVTRNTHR